MNGMDMRDQVEGNAPDEEEFETFITSEGKKGELYKIFIPNLIFMILTLGIFRFWARTRNRRYIFSRMKILGDGFEYTGTGGELFKGFLIVFVLIILPFGIIPAYYAQTIDPVKAAVIHNAQFFFFFLLYPVAVFRAYRYLFSRLSWRGVHFVLKGKALEYWAKCFLFMVALPFSLGLVFPWFETFKARYFGNNLYFGNKKFANEAKASEIFSPFLMAFIMPVAVLLVFGGFTIGFLGNTHMELKAEGADAIPYILGAFAVLLFVQIFWVLAFARYRAATWSHFISTSSLENVCFQADIGTWDFIKFSIINVLLMFITFGLAYPIVVCRHMQFFAQRLQATSVGELEKTVAVYREQAKTGEGLADALDIGAI